MPRVQDYVQEMLKLRNSNPWLYNKFLEEKHTVKRTSNNWTGIWTDLAIEQTLMRSIKSRGGLTEGRGMTESVRHLWVLSLSHSASIHSALMQLTGAQIQSSEQHIEMGPTRRQHDFQDAKKFYNWFTNRNPFFIEGEHLYGLTNGLVSVIEKDDVNCERAEEVGRDIQLSLNNCTYTSATIKRKEQIKTLDSLQNHHKDKVETKKVDPGVMFTRMVAIAERQESRVILCI